MKHLNNYKLFVEENNPNTPQGYLDSLSKKPKLKPNIQQKKPTEEVDNILQNTEEQRQNIIAKKDAIEKGLLKKYPKYLVTNQWLKRFQK